MVRRIGLAWGLGGTGRSGSWSSACPVGAGSGPRARRRDGDRFLPRLHAAGRPWRPVRHRDRRRPAQLGGRGGRGVAAICCGRGPAACPGRPGRPAAGQRARRRDVGSNVHFGTADATALAALVRDEHPDLLAVQELTPRFDRRLRAAGVERLLPFRSATTEPPALGGGRGLYSRFPLRRLAGRTTSSVRMTLPGGRALRVFNVHPGLPARRQRHLGLQPRPPALGRGGPALDPDRRFQRDARHSALRDVLVRGYRDAGEVTGNGLVADLAGRQVVPPRSRSTTSSPTAPRHRRLRGRRPAGERSSLDPRGPVHTAEQVDWPLGQFGESLHRRRRILGHHRLPGAEEPRDPLRLLREGLDGRRQLALRKRQRVSPPPTARCTSTAPAS